MKIIFRGVSLGPWLGARVERRLICELTRIQASPVEAVVTFTDENGHKGGRAMRCALTVRLPRQPTVRVDDVAETARLAFDRSFARLRRRLISSRDRSLTLARYPKKYYVAKRLLSPERASGGSSRGF